MKRFGEKAVREALRDGATIRYYEWFTLNAGYRVMIAGEIAGYIVSDLFDKLNSDNAIMWSGSGYAYREYAASPAEAEAEEAATAEAPEAEEPEVIEAEPEETEQERTDRENHEHCKRIAEELEQYTDGNVYRCTECGELCTIEEAEDEDGFTVYKTSCGCTLDYEPDQMSAFDFIADALDIEVSCSLDREYRSARIMVACGGPNIYIDTARKAVELYWWTDRAEYPISSSAADALDEAIEELWGCR